MEDFFAKARKFVKDVCIAFANTVKKFAVELYAHAEAVAVSVLGGIGVNALLSSLAIEMTLPAALNPAMVIPAISTIIILMLLWSAQHRPRFLPTPSV